IEVPYGSPDLVSLLELLGTRVRRISIGEHSKEGSHFFETVFLMLKRRINDLDLSDHILSEEISSELFLSILSHSSPEELICSIDTEHTIKARDILLGISDRIDMISMKIKCRNRPWVLGQMLYGDIESGNWVEWILSMFEKRVSSISISNYYAPICTPEEVRKIIETLISRGNPFHFQVWLHEKPVAIVVKGTVCRKR
ncbi:hypothetical protein PENTCL1PPCAC_2883, partial [Pristionchus entomophagus]